MGRKRAKKGRTKHGQTQQRSVKELGKSGKEREHTIAKASTLLDTLRSLPPSVRILVLAFLSPGVQIILSFFGACWLFWRWPLVALIYFTWIYFDRAPSRGGWQRCVSTMRSLGIWKLVADYFPAELIKTADLDPTKAYLFGYHPHGIMSLGALLNFGTEATGFAQKFPGVKMHVLGAKALFRVPFFREWLLAHGGGSVGRSTCQRLLKRGESIMIIIGGARESLEAHPDTMVLTLLERKGFVRVALSCGAALVPVLAFGENEMFAQVPNPRGSMVRRLQEKLLFLYGYTLPSFFGVGSFPLAARAMGVGSLKYGLVPFQRKLTVVVGVPIDVPHIEDPGPEIVDEYHNKYLTALRTIYEEHKDAAVGAEQHLPSFVLT